MIKATLFLKILTFLLCHKYKETHSFSLIMLPSNIVKTPLISVFYRSKWVKLKLFAYF